MIERAHADQGRGIGSDEAGVLQADEREQQADACGRRDAQRLGNAERRELADRRERRQEEQHALPRR